MKRCLFLLLAVTVAAAAVKADEPLPPPSKVIFTSPNQQIRATSDPKSGTTIEDLKQRKVLWRLSDWYRRLYVADDGKHVVSEYDGLELIPTDFNSNLVLFTFWAESKKIREVTLKDFAPDSRILEKTASHYYWGRIEGFGSRGRLKVQRVDGKAFLFDVTTGVPSG